jgi:CheY-like chemotaxis protein
LPRLASYPILINVVLIVEDEPIVRMSISDALLQAGIEVVASSNGAEALELIATRPTLLRHARLNQWI